MTSVSMIIFFFNLSRPAIYLKKLGKSSFYGKCLGCQYIFINEGHNYWKSPVFEKVDWKELKKLEMGNLKNNLK